MNKKVRVRKKFIASLLAVMMVTSVFSVAVVSAETSLNGIGSETSVSETTTSETTSQISTSQVSTEQATTQPSPTEGSGADAIGSLFDNVGVDQEASQKASQYTQPVAKFVNMVFAIILGFLALGIFLITALDLAYIALPFLRGLLAPSAPQGGGGFGGMGGQSQQGKAGLRFISDEALAAASSLSGGGSSSMGGNFGGGGFGGGFGGGGFGGGMSSEPPKMKNVLLDYLKKRVFFLVAFGVCAVLLSTTVFTDIGINIGSWVLDKILGFM